MVAGGLCAELSDLILHSFKVSRTGAVTEMVVLVNPRPPAPLPDWMRCTTLIFPYTSAGGFLGLLNGNALWATEAFGLNDLAELRHVWAFIREWLGEQPACPVSTD